MFRVQGLGSFSVTQTKQVWNMPLRPGGGVLEEGMERTPGMAVPGREDTRWAGSNFHPRSRHLQIHNPEP